MKVKEVILGNGLSRFEFETSCPCERNIPQHVLDRMIEDVIMQKNSNRQRQNVSCSCHSMCCGAVSATPIPRFMEPSFSVPNREPDGIDVHVDRPLRHMFDSYGEWADAMGRYRTLEQVAKDCDWECREPMMLPNYRSYPMGCQEFEDDWF